MRNTNSTLLYKWFDQVWNKDDEEAIDRLMTNDSNAHGIITEGQPKGAEGFKLFFRNFKSQFHNIKIDVDDVISEDDVESARTSVTAVHTLTNRNVNFSGMCMVKISDRRIAAAWKTYDLLSMH